MKDSGLKMLCRGPLLEGSDGCSIFTSEPCNGYVQIPWWQRIRLLAGHLGLLSSMGIVLYLWILRALRGMVDNESGFS